MSELWGDGAGTTTRVEDATKEMVRTRLASKANSKAKEKETVIVVDRRGISPRGQRIPWRMFQRKGSWSSGKGVWQVDEKDPQGDWKWEQPEEEKPAGSIQSIRKRK